MAKAWVYILKCSDNSYYTGKTQNLETRIAQHKKGTFEGYTANRRPVNVVYAQKFGTFIDAINAERQIKRWSRAKKEALIRGDFDLLHKLAECKNVSHYKSKRDF